MQSFPAREACLCVRRAVTVTNLDQPLPKCYVFGSFCLTCGTKFHVRPRLDGMLANENAKLPLQAGTGIKADHFTAMGELLVFDLALEIKITPMTSHKDAQTPLPAYSNANQIRVMILR